MVSHRQDKATKKPRRRPAPAKARLRSIRHITAAPAASPVSPPFG